MHTKSRAHTHTHTHPKVRMHAMPVKSTHTRLRKGGGGLKTNLKASTGTEREVCSRKAISITGQNTVWRGKFEGREGRAVTESKKKRIPDLDSRGALSLHSALISVLRVMVTVEPVMRDHSTFEAVFSVSDTFFFVLLCNGTPHEGPHPF